METPSATEPAPVGGGAAAVLRLRLFQTARSIVGPELAMRPSPAHRLPPGGSVLPFAA